MDQAIFLGKKSYLTDITAHMSTDYGITSQIIIKYYILLSSSGEILDILTYIKEDSPREESVLAEVSESI